MNAREVYNAISSGNREDAQQALFQLLGMVQELSGAVLAIAHDVEHGRSGRDPLTSRSRLWLSEFLELPRREQGLD
jgi:hypothetical protein